MYIAQSGYIRSSAFFFRSMFLCELLPDRCVAVMCSQWLKMSVCVCVCVRGERQNKRIASRKEREREREREREGGGERE